MTGIADNYNLPLSLVKQALSEAKEGDLVGMARRNDLDAVTIDELFAHNIVKVNHILAKRGMLSAEQLESVVNQVEIKHIIVALDAPNLTRKQLEKFLYCSDWRLRKACLRSPIITPEDVRCLSRDRSHNVREAVYSRKNINQMLSLKEWQRGVLGRDQHIVVSSAEVPFEVFDEQVLSRLSNYTKNLLLTNKFWVARGWSEKIRDLYPDQFPFGTFSRDKTIAQQNANLDRKQNNENWLKRAIETKGYLRYLNEREDILKHPKLSENQAVEILSNLLTSGYLTSWETSTWRLFQKKITSEKGLKMVLGCVAKNPNINCLPQLLKFNGWTAEMLENLTESNDIFVLRAIIENKAINKTQLTKVISRGGVSLERATTRRVLEKHFSLYELLNLPIAPAELLRIQSVADFVKDNVEEGGVAETFLAHMVSEHNITMNNLLSLAKIATTE
jgi:hypothetical protein